VTLHDNNIIHDNSIARALYKIKLDSPETQTRTGMVSVYCRSNNDQTRKIFRSRQNISSNGVSLSTDCSMLILSYL